MSTTTAPVVHSTWNAVIRTILGAATVVALVLLAFAWPTYAARVKDMPLAVVAPAAQQQAITQKVTASGAFDVQQAADRDAAVKLIKHRDVYGAIVVTPTGTEVLTSSAASTAASQMLAGAAQGMAKEQAVAQASAAATKAGQALTAAQAKASQASAPSITVTDVVPLVSKDSRGAGLGVASLPLAMGGMIGGVMTSLLVVGWKRRLATVLGYGTLGGLFLALVLHSWFGFVPGNFVTIWLVMAAALAATGAFITGAQSLLGQPGIALGAVLTMFIGNPISSMAMPAEWLPGAWGAIGQWFVPGAAGHLLRNAAYFPDAPVLQGWLALATWFVVGLVLTQVGRHRNDEVVHIEGATEPEA